ncbi:hypothetical protein [Stenotrophomonas oahuensis]|uniref:Lipoprotein n=1 Tax=Stenotrophomonas oahuensis TaxID=3003271 RepID=A0ABY9YWF2_9GAMM|nr:hypothetical protein [Stenotrophomonas sp. A5586]WNH54509.1 hypothetical protein PDM29_09605 [Stenotrophomonas sp. A5586]
MARRILISATLLAAVAAAGYFTWAHSRLEEPATSVPQNVHSGARDTSPSASESQATNAEVRSSGPITVLAFEELKSRAKAGDAVAQRQLAQTYDACFMVNMSPENYLSDYETRAKYVGDSAEASEMLRVARARAEECRNVDGGAPIPLELIKGWYAQASENGDLASKATSISLSAKKPDKATSNNLWEGVTQSGDPAAAFSLGELAAGLGLIASDDQPEDLLSGVTSGYAWMVIACRNGYDCSPNSRLMQNMCLNTGRCAGEDFEQFVRSSVITSSDSQVLDKKIERISGFLKAP